MADGPNIDSLQIEISAASTDAVKKVNDLIDAIKRLSQAGSGLGSIPDNIRNIGSSAGRSTPAAKTQKKNGPPQPAPKQSETETVESEKSLERIRALLVEGPSLWTAFGDAGGKAASNISEKFRELSDFISPAVSQMKELGANISEAAGNFGKFVSNSKPVQVLGGALRTITQPLALIGSAASKGASAVAKAFSSISSAASAAKKKIEEITKPLKKAFEGLKKTVHDLLNTLKKIGGAGLSGLKSIGKYVGSQITGPFTKAAKSAQSLFKRIGNIAMYRAVRSAMKMVTDGFKTGMDNLYQYSRLVGTEFTPAMDKIATSALYLKNSLGAMTAPIVQTLAPAIDMLTDRFVELLNVIGKTMAALSGKSVFSQARKHAVEYADAAADAAKKTKSFTLGIDELNVIENSAGSAASAAEDYGSMFEEVEVPSEIGDWAKSVRDAIENGDWAGVGEILAGKINDIVSGLDMESLGRSLGEKINNGLTAAYNFIKNVDFSALGEKVAAGLNGIFDKVDLSAYVGIVVEKFNAAFNFLFGLFDNLDWAQLGNSLADGLKAVFTIDWDALVNMLDAGISGVQTAVNTFVFGINFESIGEKLAEPFNKITDTIDPAAIGETIASLVQSAVDTAYGFVTSLDFAAIGEWLAGAFNGFFGEVDWEKAGQMITDGITGVFDALGAFILGLDMGQIASDVSDLIISIFSGMATWIEEIDWAVAATKVYEMLKSALDGIDFAGITSSFFELLGAAFGATVQFVAAFISNVASDIADYFSQYIGDLDGTWWENGFNIVAGILKGIADALANIVTWIANNIFAPFIEGFKKAFGIHSPSTVMAEQGGFIIQGLLNGLIAGWTSIVDFFGARVEGIKTTLANAWEAISTTAGAAWNGIKSVIGTAWDSLKTWAFDKFGGPEGVSSILGKTWDVIRTTAGEKWGAFAKAITETWEGVKATAAQKFAGVKENISTAWENTKTAAGEKWEEIKTNLGKAWEGINKEAKTKFDAVKDTVMGVWTSLKDNIKTPINAMLGFIESFVNGVINGINKMIRTLNSLSFEVPDWVPGIGGGTFGFNLSELKNITIPRLASGGILDAGQMFIARERGPELVGNIGNKTAVVNNEQIISGISRGVENANEEQNALLREQNELLRAILQKDTSVRIGNKEIKRAYDTANRQSGASIMEGGVFA